MNHHKATENPDAGKRRNEFALFDLDLTLAPYDTQLLFCNFVLRAEPWRRAYFLLAGPFLALYCLKLVGDLLMKRVFLSYLWRMPGDRVDAYAQRFAKEVFMNTCYPEVLGELERHRSEGRSTILSTASPEFYARPIARELGMDHCFGTGIVICERMPLFAEVNGPNNKGQAKVRAMEQVIQQGYAAGSNPALAGSYAYSDSAADLPMLELVDHPVMVDPGGRLREKGNRAGWRTISPKRPYRGKTGRLVAGLLQALGLFPLPKE